MDDAGIVGSRERTGALHSNIERFARFHWLASQSLAERLTVNELGSNEVNGIGLVNFMGGDDIRVIQSRSSFSFLHKAAQAVLIRSNLYGQKLQRNPAIQFRILRQIYLAHSARADLFDYF